MRRPTPDANHNAGGITVARRHALDAIRRRPAGSAVRQRTPVAAVGSATGRAASSADITGVVMGESSRSAVCVQDTLPRARRPDGLPCLRRLARRLPGRGPFQPVAVPSHRPTTLTRGRRSKPPVPCRAASSTSRAGARSTAAWETRATPSPYAVGDALVVQKPQSDLARSRPRSRWAVSLVPWNRATTAGAGLPRSSEATPSTLPTPPTFSGASAARSSTTARTGRRLAARPCRTSPGGAMRQTGREAPKTRGLGPEDPAAAHRDRPRRAGVHARAAVRLPV